MKANQNGMALLVVLGAVSVLLAVGLHLSRFTHQSVLITAQRTDRFIAGEMAKSAIHLAMALLAEDAAKTDVDSIQEPWADPVFLSNMIEQLGFSQGTISLTIVDELGKIQVNSLLQEFPGHTRNPDQVLLWERWLETVTPPDESREILDPDVIVNALGDWMDSGDDDAVSGFSGAESASYAGLSPPYTCANAEFSHVSELLNVKGFHFDRFVFQSGGTDPEDPWDEEDNTFRVTSSIPVTPSNPNTLDTLDSPVTPGDIFTVYGLSDLPPEGTAYQYPGRININTAGLQVLQALLPRGMEEFARDLLDYRAQKSEDGDMFMNPLEKGWYTRVIGLSQKEKERFDRMIRYDSNLFKASVTVRLNQARIGLSAFIRRERLEKSNRWACRIIQVEKN
jgi:general secretion pathway protein K